MTGCERILARLERGPATAAELYAETYTVVHSRISDLRKRGHVITCEHLPGETGAKSYLYTICSDDPSTLRTASPSGPGAVDVPHSTSSEQLSLDAERFADWYVKTYGSPRAA